MVRVDEGVQVKGRGAGWGWGQSKTKLKKPKQSRTARPRGQFFGGGVHHAIGGKVPTAGQRWAAGFLVKPPRSRDLRISPVFLASRKQERHPRSLLACAEIPCLLHWATTLLVVGCRFSLDTVCMRVLVRAVCAKTHNKLQPHTCN